MLVNTKVIKTEGDLGGEKIAMGVDENSLVHIMSLLSDLYSDKIMAVVREYSTNALDSHIASGQTRPIELSSPTTLDPNFTVRDYGVGMDADDIRNIYSKYGASSKRTNNVESGMLGLGCKSGLTYSNQFTLIGVKGGFRTLVSISRSQDGSGQMEVVDISPSDEPNGVTVKVPVNNRFDRDTFVDRIHKFATFVNPDKILVDGYQPTTQDWTKISDRFWIRRNSWSDNSNFIVMGNVAYPLSMSRFDAAEGDEDLPHNYSFAYFADMGDVDFPPSREELMFTDKTLATVDKIKKEFNPAFNAYLQNEIDNCASFAEAFTKRTNLKDRYYFKPELSWQNKLIPDYVSMRRANWDLEFKERSSSKAGTRTTAPKDDVVIFNWKNKSFTSVHGRKITTFLKENHDDYEDSDTAILLDELEYPEIYEDCLVLDWDEVKKTKVTKAVKGQKPKRAWYNFDRQRVVPDEAKDIYFGFRDEYPEGALRTLVLSDTSEFYFITPNQEKRFLELNPYAQKASTAIANAIVDWVNNLTQDELDMFTMYKDFYRTDMINIDDIVDPDFKALLEFNEAGNDWERTKLLDKRRNMEYWAPYADKTIMGTVKVPQVEYKGEGIADKYPLLNVIDSYQVRYSNNKYDILRILTNYCNDTYTKLQGSLINGKL